jgi:hypothetical protein
MLTTGAYLVGAAELGLVVAALVHGAYRVRRALLPGWTGAPARLAELVLGVAGLIWLSELLGTFGAFTEAGLLIGAVVGGAACGLAADALAGRRGPVSDPAPPAPPSSSLAKLIAAAACAALAAGWMVPTLGTLAAGMDRADTLWYHMPLAARFVQTGYLSHIHFFDPVFLASFYPANSEVVHAAPILFFARDIVSPIINLGWLAMALVACWCIGRPYGLGPQALVGGSVALGSQSLVEFQAGEALNDITGVAFVLAAAAILVNGYAAGAAEPVSAPAMSASRRGRMRPLLGGSIAGPDTGPAPLVVAGIAAGLSAGTKLSFLAPVAALAVGVMAIAPRTTRVRVGLWFGLPALAAGGYWYARNLFAVGNPIPYIGHLGPISLPAPVRDFDLRPGFSVFHYWNDTDVWRHWLGPGLDQGFGTLWPVTILAMLGFGVYALWRGAEPVLRMLGGVVLVTAVAYVFTPLTAAGEEGQPIAFVWNLRYLAPAVALGLGVLPCLPALRATAARRAATLAALTVLLAFTVGSLVQWKQGHTKGAIAAALLVLAVAGAVALLRSRGALGPAGRRRTRVAIGVAVAVTAVGAGWAEQKHYLEHRYEDTGDAQDLDQALRWARDVQGARIAVGGIRGVFTQYAFYGTDISNHVQWLGQEGPHDAFLRIPDCRQWREALNAGGYTHVVTTFDPYLPSHGNSPEGRWTESDPNAKVVVREGPVRVFELTGPMDPSGCQGQAPLPEKKLHGVPNLNPGG